MHWLIISSLFTVTLVEYTSEALAIDVSRGVAPCAFLNIDYISRNHYRTSIFQVGGRLTRELYKTLRRRIIQGSETTYKQRESTESHKITAFDGKLLGPKTCYNIYLALDNRPADEIKRRFQLIAQNLIKVGAEHTNVYYYGLKKLAQPLNKKHEACFISFELDIYPSLIQHIRKKLCQEEHVLRVLVLRDSQADKSRRGFIMSNIKSFGDYVEDRAEQSYSYAGGRNSALGVEEDGHTVHLYSGGFTVDDGPFRSLSEPENALFLSAVRNGVAPPEFQEHGKDVHVYLIDESHRTYSPPQSQSNLSTTKTTGAALPVQEICIGTNAGNVTTLRVKLFDHRQINLKVSPDITIGELRSIMSDKSGLSSSSFRLMYGFPPRELIANDSDTLKEKDLLGCAIFQHMII
ncbi:UBX domain-containing protein [Babesia ovata]|uniref:ubiquitinyl hydrolase 1 n=1 Tax=Babesia ovata TaxID=189622 RepID=A0A2H6KHD9_9APIC|nr:UBX domain-containing protein [Babesia ovata]GBE62389.1 UBX domain-containing protein [Babesia ovata]